MTTSPSDSAPSTWVEYDRLTNVVGERLLEARRRLGATQREVAQSAKIGAPDLSRFERGRRLPTVDKLHRLCAVLRVSADWLLGLA